MGPFQHDFTRVDSEVTINARGLEFKLQLMGFMKTSLYRILFFSVLFSSLLWSPPLFADDFTFNVNVVINRVDYGYNFYSPEQSQYQNIRGQLPCMAQIERELRGLREEPRIRMLMQGFAEGAETTIDNTSIDFHFVVDRETRQVDNASVEEFFSPQWVVVHIKGRPWERIYDGAPSGTASLRMPMYANGTCDAEAILDRIRNQRVLRAGAADSSLEPSFIGDIPIQDFDPTLNNEQMIQR